MLFNSKIFKIPVCAICLSFAVAATGQDTTFTYQGELKQNGNLVNGSFDFDFSIWDSGTGGGQIGVIAGNNLLVNDGRFVTDLDFGSEVFDGSERWIEIAVDGNVLNPRQAVTRSPYSIHTRGIHVDASEDVGIGTDTPEAQLHVNGDIRSEQRVAIGNDAWFGLGGGPYPNFERVHDFSHRITDFSSANLWSPMLSVVTMDPDVDLIGAEVYGNSFELHTADSSDKDVGDLVNGLFGGTFHRGSGTLINAVGGFFVSNVDGPGNITHNSGLGVNAGGGFSGQGSITNNYGVNIQAGHPGIGGSIENNYSMNIQSPNNARPINTNYGIFIEDQNAAQTANYSIYSEGGDVYFNGDLDVTGALSKGGGSFKIDHPLDPENKFLYHSFVESPDMMNIYNGNVTLDSSGRATVTMPDWFDALNRDFRYQLTCIGGFAPMYVESRIKDNQFTIAGGSLGQEVSWQVTGVRQDAWAEANRIPVEQEKAKHESGRYLHPTAYGLDRARSIEPANKSQRTTSQAKLNPNEQSLNSRSSFLRRMTKKGR